VKKFLIATIAIGCVAACTIESSLPLPTGKGSVRAINAIPTSPEIGFLIEERTIEGVAYKSNSAPKAWDDLEYTFNFEIRTAGSTQTTRIASRLLDVVADTEYTFVVTGTLANPAIQLWELPERQFSGSETVFELRVGNAADALGSVDVYVAADGVAPVAGAEFATLAPGEVSAAIDMEQGDYVVTATPPGDPGTVLFESRPTSILAVQSVLITLFSGDANDTAPVTARAYNRTGLTLLVPDRRFAPTLRFLQATMDLAASDVYDDATLSNPIVSNLNYGDITADIDVPVGEIPLTFTAAGNPGAILLEDTVTTIDGTRLNFVVTTAADGSLQGTPAPVDRRSIETSVRLTFLHAASNHELVDLYVVDTGTAIDDVLPRQLNLNYGFQTPSLSLTAGDYDVYVTTAGEKTVLDGPIPFNVALGDVYEGMLINRVDPSLAELKLIKNP